MARDTQLLINSPSPSSVLELLVCGDCDSATTRLSNRLRDVGFHRVATATDGAETLKQVARHAPRVLITTLRLQDMKYWAFVRTLRTGKAYPRSLPILALADETMTAVDQAAARELDVWLVHDHEDIDLVQTVHQAQEGAPKLRLLIVEDDLEFSQLLQSRLIGYDVTAAATGRAGIAAYREHAFDIVILDLRLPDLGGEEVLDEIHRTNPRQLVIVATGDAGRDVNLLQRGADQFLVKPLTVQCLQQACDQLWVHAAVLHLARQADDLKDHLFLANECMLAGRTAIAHAHIKEGLDTRSGPAER